MQRPGYPLAASRRQQELLGPLGLWLGAGSVLLLVGLLPLHSVLLGWSAPFWLIVAPLLLILGIAPGLPGQWLVQCRSGRRATRTRIWN